MRNKCDNVGESHVKQKNSRGAVVCQAIHLPWAILSCLSSGSYEFGFILVEFLSQGRSLSCNAVQFNF